MTSKLADYEHELATAKGRLDQIAIDVGALLQEQSELTNVVRGWEAIIARERKPIGATFPPPNASQQISANSNETSSPQSDDSDEDGENKTQFVRDQVMAHATKGMTPADLKAAANTIGMKYPPSWPYGPIQRLKKKGEIIKRKGRFYPKGAANAQSGLALAG